MYVRHVENVNVSTLGYVESGRSPQPSRSERTRCEAMYLCALRDLARRRKFEACRKFTARLSGRQSAQTTRGKSPR